MGDGRPGCGVSTSVGDCRTFLKKKKKEKKYRRAAAGGLRKEERKNVRRSSRDTQGVSKLRLYNKTESFERAKKN